MTAPTTKEIEAADFEIFRDRLADFPVGPVRHLDRPDFRVESPEYVVGIEFTRLHIPGGPPGLAPRAAESISNEICREARTMAESFGLPPMQVAISFSSLDPMDSAARRELASQIAEFVAANIPDVGERRTLRRSGPHNTRLPRFVRSIFVSHLPGRVWNQWYEPSVGWVLVRAAETIQEAIAAKSGKLGAYLRDVDECWLVLVADDLKASGKIQPDQSTFDHVYDSPFARTYFLNTMKDSPDLLQTRSRN